MKRIIYLDNSATTKVKREVIELMKKAMNDDYGNPSSPHEMGEKAREIVNQARKNIAREIGAKIEEIIFTSGATESNNLVLFGLTGDNDKNSRKKKIIISSIEHPSVYEPAMSLKEKNYNVVEISVDKEGLIDIKKLENEIDDTTLLVSIIHGQSEIGVLQNIKKIGEICEKKDVFFHVDAAQSFTRERINVKEMQIDFLSASAHKIFGPKGIGFLFVRNGARISQIIYGGGQEKGLRSGTENVPGIAGFGKAVDLMKRSRKEKIIELREYFMDELEKIGGKIGGSKERRLENNVHVSFSGEDAEILIEKLSQKGVMCSAKSACSTKSNKENRILKAIGLSEEEISGSLRFSLSEGTSKKDINFVVRVLKQALGKDF